PIVPATAPNVPERHGPSRRAPSVGFGPVHRSRVVLVVVATLLSGVAGVAWGLGAPAPASSARSQSEGDQVHVKNPKTAKGGSAAEGIKAPWVIQENARAGTSDWRLAPNKAKGSIEGYADKVSAQAGDRVTLFVSTDAPSYQVEAYRIGYYGGLGGRLIWKSVGR